VISTTAGPWPPTRTLIVASAFTTCELRKSAGKGVGAACAESAPSIRLAARPAATRRKRRENETLADNARLRRVRGRHRGFENVHRMPCHSAAGFAGVRRAALLLQRRRNLLETGLGAAFVDQAARCAADTDTADNLVTGLDHHGAGKQQDSRHTGQRGGGRVGGELRYQFALQILLEERSERDDGVGLATARVQRVRRGAFVLSTARVRPLRSSTVTLTLWPSLSQLVRASAAACDANRALSSLGAVDWACANDAQNVSATAEVRRRKPMWIPRWGTGDRAAAEDSPVAGRTKARPAPRAANAIQASRGRAW